LNEGRNEKTERDEERDEEIYIYTSFKQKGILLKTSY